jgi:hypothetical protein
MPMYQNIIDPNLTAVKQDEVYQWTATDFIVEECINSRFNTLMGLQLSMKRKRFKLSKFVLENIKTCLRFKRIPKANIASPISNIPIENNKELYVAIEEIFNIALPILSKITKPALFLPGKLQAVIKAQRIYLKPGKEYEGVWHRDRKHENIVSVAIYYHRVPKQLIGGDLEFIDKQPINKFRWTDDDYTTDNAKEDVSQVPYCRFPVKTGTLVVFSNYQMIHRVLKMTCNGVDTNSPDGWASRDFVLFFIVDQSKPLLSTKIDLTVLDDRQQIRTDMFKEQLRSTGSFVPDTELVYSTGNGTAAQIGWLNDTDYYESELLDHRSFSLRLNVEGYKNIKILNDNPPLNRGISWAFEQNTEEENNKI